MRLRRQAGGRGTASTAEVCRAAVVAGLRHAAALLCSALLLGGCSMMLPQTTALQDTTPPQLPEHVKLDNVPFVPQEDNLCGPAALKMAMAGGDVDVPLDELKRQVFLPGRKGTLQAEMLAAPRRHGLVGYKLAPRLEDALREVADGTPVIVLQDYGVWPVPVWHYAVIVGYDYPKREVILHSGLKSTMTMPFAVLEYLWKQSEYWAMVAMPPGRVPVTAKAADYVDAVAAVEQAGDLATAKTAFEATLARWPDNEKAAVGLANADHGLGKLAEAEAVLKSAVARHPDSVALLNNLAQTLSDLGRNGEALEIIDRAASLGGPFADAVRDTRQQILERIKAAAR